jgi:hypothetical protein
MSKAEVTYVMGNYTVRGAVQNKFGQTVEVWEVQLSQPKTATEIAGQVTVAALTFGLTAPVLLVPASYKNYWLYFVNGRLVQWGEAGDWRREADRIYEVRFGTAESLTQ